ncbi:TetR/AcrR family transcriptional regulator [Nonomuraea sp. NN258]|uniref:TetR/AcrR family transcriptional regulator n=1 Tax=Nonomuraea antri TaxID=2730852 RepID=UPI00156919A1|nr:TetR/AcrR family transcriptional regulator [Nonomuraea antri]NRQ32544.1 TetR/AcrR family transcriptional regulator [Nonomuraea antri]
MGRPPRHDVDRLLDAAADLVSDAGPATVTIAAVARAAGAPSGSIYHRFPSRASLLAALWLRTLGRFHEGYLAALDSEPAVDAAPAAARHVVAWCRANPGESRVLLYGPADFDEAGWPEEARELLRAANDRLRAALDALAGRLGAAAPADRERLYLAAVDLPYATVRRHHLAGRPLPAYAEDLAASCAAALTSA